MAEDQQSQQSDTSESDQERLQNISVFRSREKVEDGSINIDNSILIKIKAMLTCPICLDVFKDPVYTKVCSHRFCKDCIEKSIRSSQNKSCPTCRKSLTSKRILRQDNTISELTTLIVGNVNLYIQNQEQLDKEWLENNFIQMQKMDSKTEKKYKKRKNVISNNDENLDEDQGSNSEQVQPRKYQQRKKRKQNPSQEKQAQEKQNADDNDENSSGIINDEDMMNLQKLLEEQPEFLQNIDIFITIQLEVLPSDNLSQKLQKNVFKQKDKTPLIALQLILCRKFNLKEEKYYEKFKLYIKENGRFLQLNNNETLKAVNDKYWKYKGDLEVYDASDFFQQMIKKSNKLSNGENRILYYSFSFDSL